MFFLGAKRTKNARHTGFASRSRLLLVSYHVTSLIRLSLVACVCRSNLGNKRTRFTHSRHRMAHTLRHFCSCSSIGTDTRCCSNGAGLFLKLPFTNRLQCRSRVSQKPRNLSSRPNGRDLKNQCRYVSHTFDMTPQTDTQAEVIP